MVLRTSGSDGGREYERGRGEVQNWIGYWGRHAIYPSLVINF